MAHTDPYPGPERRTRDRAAGPLRRRQEQPVEVERRAGRDDGFDIAGALELYLDECKTRGAMTRLLQQWLTDARAGDASNREPGYIEAVERAIGVMSHAPDVHTGIAMLQRR